MNGRRAPIDGSSASGPYQARGLTVVDLAFSIVVVVLAYYRYRILGSNGAPPTIDSGNWIAYGDQILGDGVRSATIVYPPVVPIISKVSVSIFGLTAGVSGLAAAASTAPAIGTYVALRRLGPGLIALAPSILVLGASSIGEATAWGGFPQLIGFGLAPIALVLLDRFLRTWDAKSALTAGFAFMALLATSHLVGATVAVAAAVMIGQAILSPLGPRPRWQQVAVGSGLLLLPVLWLTPLYISFFQAIGGISTEFKFFTELTWANLVDRIEFLYRDLPWLWRPLIPLTAIAPIIFYRNHRTPLWRVATSLLVAIVATSALAREARSLYLITPFVALGLSLWIVHGPDLFRRWANRRFSGREASHRSSTVVVAALLVAAGVQVSTGLTFFESQRAFYGLLSPELVSGLESVRDSSQPDDVLAVTSLHDGPLGWWVEAIAQRETIYGVPTRWLLFEDEIRRAKLANSLFIPPFPDTERIRRAADTGIDLILVPTRWVFYDEQAIGEFGASYPGAVEYVTDELVVIDPALVP